ncbi:hypothetical protein ACF0H5_002361 [Mactra antiquata]
MDPFKAICPSMNDACLVSVALNIFFIIVFIVFSVYFLCNYCKRRRRSISFERFDDSHESAYDNNERGESSHPASSPIDDDNNKPDGELGAANTESEDENGGPREDNDGVYNDSKPDTSTRSSPKRELGGNDSNDPTLKIEVISEGDSLDEGGKSSEASCSDSENVKHFDSNIDTPLDIVAGVEDKDGDNFMKIDIMEKVESPMDDTNSINGAHDSGDDKKTDDKEENKIPDDVTIDVQVFSNTTGSFAPDAVNALVSDFNSKSSVKLKHSMEYDIEKLESDKLLFILCVNSSRLGTDVKSAISKLSGMRKAVLLIYPFEKHALPCNRSSQILTELDLNKVEGMFDFAYTKDKGFYECDMNSHCLNELKDYLHTFVSNGKNS